jgi:hypothetical protein
MALHEQAVGATDEWFTPAYIFEALACRFDMDVASPGWGHTSWIPADAFLTHDSLTRRWKGFVWMNESAVRRSQWPRAVARQVL